MAKELAFLEFTIMFDPSETWSHLHDFEGSFAKFLDTIGLEAEIVTPLGVAPRRIVFIRKKIEIEPIQPKVEETKGPQKAFGEVKKGIK